MGADLTKKTASWFKFLSKKNSDWFSVVGSRFVKFLDLYAHAHGGRYLLVTAIVVETTQTRSVADSRRITLATSKVVVFGILAQSVNWFHKFIKKINWIAASSTSRKKVRSEVRETKCRICILRMGRLCEAVAKWNIGYHSYRLLCDILKKRSPHNCAPDLGSKSFRSDCDCVRTF